MIHLLFALMVIFVTGISLTTSREKVSAQLISATMQFTALGENNAQDFRFCLSHKYNSQIGQRHITLVATFRPRDRAILKVHFVKSKPG